MPRFNIYLATQTAELIENNSIIGTYLISSALRGAGERYGSLCTPRGHHIVRAKIGAGQPINTVFVGRRPTGEVYDAELAAKFPGRDWILTRILWLSGCEPGFNRLADVDTMRRYIYIHGSPDMVELGKPGSIGCIRMHNADILHVFDHLNPGDRVEIDENGN